MGLGLGWDGGWDGVGMGMGWGLGWGWTWNGVVVGDRTGMRLGLRDSSCNAVVAENGVQCGVCTLLRWKTALCAVNGAQGWPRTHF